MTKPKKTSLIILFCVGITLLFVLCMYFNLSGPLVKSLLLVSLMGLFYMSQEPDVLAICGFLGLGYICTEAYLDYDRHNWATYIRWIVESLSYTGIYLMVWIFCIRLQKLKRISELHELVISGTTAGLWEWPDVNKDEQWWSPRYYKLLGYENGEIAPTLTNLGELIHPDDRDLAFAVLQEYMAGKRTDLEYEYRIRTKSGEYKWFLGSGEVQFEQGTNKPLRVVGSIVDIDQKKQQELATAYKSALVELSLNAVITTDPEFKVVSWNQGAEQLYQIKAEDTIGKYLRDFMDTTYPYYTEEEVLEEFERQGFWRGEAHQVTKQGHKVYVLSSVRIIKDSKGKAAGIVAINSDLSMLHVNNELNAALKMLENSTQYMEQLAYVSAHDLKSPITTLQGLLNHLVESKAIVPGHETTFEMIRNIVEQMKSTSISLSSILQLRKNLSSHDFASENVSVAQVVRDVLDMLKAPITANGAEINVNIEKGLQMRIHHSFLKNILYNLISNSLKFKHPDRLPIIGISAVPLDGHITISVADNGSGIDLARYQDKLFTIFPRMHGGIEVNGVGLHSVKMIVDFYKGTINVESRKGEGTIISITLPVSPIEAD